MPFQKGNQLAKRPRTAKTPRNDAEKVELAVRKAAAKGNIVAARLYLAYYAGLHKRDSGPVLSDRIKALLEAREQLLLEIGLDEQFLALEPPE